MTKPNFKTRSVYIHDNLDLMSAMDNETVDLIYLDPPFNSNDEYNFPFKKAREVIDVMMQDTEIKKKIDGIGLALDDVRYAGFMDVWRMNNKRKEEFEMIKQNTDSYVRNISTIIDSADKYHGESIKAYLSFMVVRLLEMRRILKPNGSIYLHCDPTMSHWLKIIMDCIFGVKKFRNEIVWYYSSGGGRSSRYFSKQHDLLYWYSKADDYTFNPDPIRIPYKSTSNYAKSGIKSKKGKKYLPNPKGKIPDDVWEIPIINPMSKERTGWPTQKPLVLLDRIIKSASNEGEIVFDPFCGCATSLVAAEDLGREWVGADISPIAYGLLWERMISSDKVGGLFSATMETELPNRTDYKPFMPSNKLKWQKQLKKKLFEREGYNPNDPTAKMTCTYCKEDFVFENFTLDHKIPKSRRRDLEFDESNIQLVCHTCNAKKGDLTDQEYRIKLNKVSLDQYELLEKQKEKLEKILSQE